jgi:hypothetical protein
MNDRQIKLLEKYVKSEGKGLFKDVKVTVDNFQFDIGIYVDWDYFPKNHGVYRLNDSFLKKLYENVRVFLKLLGINENTYYFLNIVIENNFDEQPINEMERDWRDKEYSEQYDRIGKKFVDLISELITSYREDDKSISLYNENDKRLLSFFKSTGELYYNSDIHYDITNFIPVYIWARHGKYIMSDLFEELFPDYKVRDVMSAGMN